MIPEPQHLESLLPQPLIPSLILDIPHVLSAVDLDHQPPLKAREVDDIGAKRDLPAESDSEGISAKLFPEATLGVGHA